MLHKIYFCHKKLNFVVHLGVEAKENFDTESTLLPHVCTHSFDRFYCFLVQLPSSFFSLLCFGNKSACEKSKISLRDSFSSSIRAASDMTKV